MKLATFYLKTDPNKTYKIGALMENGKSVADLKNGSIKMSGSESNIFNF